MAIHLKKLGDYEKEDSRKNEKCLCFEVCALWLSWTIESSRLYIWKNMVECRWYPTASSARICHLCIAGLASSNDHLLKLFAHYIGYRYVMRKPPIISNFNTVSMHRCNAAKRCLPSVSQIQISLTLFNVYIVYSMLVSKSHHAYLSYIHACMGFRHHDLLFKYLI